MIIKDGEKDDNKAREGGGFTKCGDVKTIDA